MAIRLCRPLSLLGRFLTPSGAIVTNNKTLYEKCWTLHNCGRRRGRSGGQHYELGSNYRMTPFQAALLQVQLRRLAPQIPHRLYNIQLLDRGLSQIEGITPQYRGHRTLHQAMFTFSTMSLRHSTVSHVIFLSVRYRQKVYPVAKRFILPFTRLFYSAIALLERAVSQ